MTALEYMEKQAQSNRINYNRQVLRNAPEKDLENIKKNVGYYEEAVEALNKVGGKKECLCETCRYLDMEISELDNPCWNCDKNYSEWEPKGR